MKRKRKDDGVPHAPPKASHPDTATKAKKQKAPPAPKDASKGAGSKEQPAKPGQAEGSKEQKVVKPDQAEAGRGGVKSEAKKTTVPVKRIDSTTLSSNWKKLAATINASVVSKKKKSDAPESVSEDEAETTLPPLKKQKQKERKLPPTDSDDTRLTKYVALDCEMVGVGENGSDSVLARVTIVNSFGNVVYDQFVAAQEKVTDFRTRWSGVRKKDLTDAPHFKRVQKEVADIIKGRIVVGHALHNDFEALLLSHPHNMIRDTAKYGPFMRGKRKPKALRKLAKEHLGVTIQKGEHDSGEDARAALLLYKLVRKKWERAIKLDSKHGHVIKNSMKRRVEDAKQTSARE